MKKILRLFIVPAAFVHLAPLHAQLSGTSLDVGSGNSLDANGYYGVIGSSNAAYGSSGGMASLQIGNSNTLSDAVGVLTVGENNSGWGSNLSTMIGLGNYSQCFTTAVIGSFNNVWTTDSLVVGSYNSVNGDGVPIIVAGQNNEISSAYGGAFAFGTGLAASYPNPGLTLFGQYNDVGITSNSLFVIGNGSDSSNRRDAFEVFQNGDIKIPGGKLSIFATPSSTSGIVLDPAASQITINGQPVLTSDASGNVGIGTGAAAPFTNLQVQGATAGKPQVLVNSTSSSVSPAIELKDSAATPNRWWLASGASNATDGKFVIQDARQGQPRLVIDASGNVGIGTTSPSAPLTVSGKIAGGLSANHPNIISYYAIPSSASYIAGNDNNSSTFYIANTGTTNPSATLGFSIPQTDGSQRPAARIYTGWSNSNNQQARMDFHVKNGGNDNNPVLSLLYDGKTGLGTTTPNSKLNVKGVLSVFGASQNTVGNATDGDIVLPYGQSLRFVNDSSNDTMGMVSLGSYGGVNNSLVIGNPTGASWPASIQFRTGPYPTGAAERMRIDGNGNVGIGTTTPQAKLDVNGDAKFSGAINLFASNYNSSTPNSGKIVIQPSTTGSSITIDGQPLVTSTSTTAQSFTAPSYSFNSGSTNRMTIDSAGNIGIGTTTPSNLLNIYSPAASTPMKVVGVNGAYLAMAFDAAGRGNLTVRGEQGGTSNGGAYGIFDGYQEGFTAFMARSAASGARVMRMGYAASSGGYSNSFLIQSLNDANTSITATPFIIQNGAPSNSFFLSSTGNVGMGTLTPAATLHVMSTAEPFRIGYDVSNYVSQVVGSAGGYTLAPTVTNGVNLYAGAGSNAKGWAIGGTDIRALLTLQKNDTSLYSVDTDMGDMGREFVMENLSNSNAANQFANISLQVNPIAGFSGGRVLGDIRLVRETANQSNAFFLFSAFRQGGAYKDFAKVGYDSSYYVGNLGVGTTTPQAKLDVNGNVSLGTGVTSVSGQVVVGKYNDVRTNDTATTPSPTNHTDGVFVIGAGSGSGASAANALRVLADGTVLVKNSGDIGMGPFTNGPRP